MSLGQRPFPWNPRYRRQLNVGLPNRDAVRAQQVGRTSHEICPDSLALDTSSFISPKQPKGLGKRNAAAAPQIFPDLRRSEKDILETRLQEGGQTPRSAARESASTLLQLGLSTTSEDTLPLKWPRLPLPLRPNRRKRTRSCSRTQRWSRDSLNEV